MASIQEPEVQFAQRLASNEKPIRTKALKKLRKYISVRSQKTTGGFTGDELLKLWKGLFYCLWMQDKPLLQEELSNQISTLIHSFHDISGQLLYLESFLQTFKREWTGIDRLRMDKFFQLVRFMFRQTFELLKRKNWDSSVVGRFLELLTAQLLQSSSAAPSGLQFHILDLYMTELAAVGSAELTAEQNLIFLEPFCKMAAKTKDRVLFRAICSSIFSTIIDQAPFAIEDLMKEVKGFEDSDSGQTSEEDEENQLKENERKPLSKKGRQVNGCKSKYDDGDFDPLEDLETELPHDDDIGPVLQFDYAALADKLFELASRTSTPSHNRQKLYRIIKVLRDLSEGVFPQDEYPEEVSTDEDDEMFGSRKRMKRVVCHPEEGAPAPKKIKGNKKEAPTRSTEYDEFGKDKGGQADRSTNDQRKKKKAEWGQSAGSEENGEKSDQGQTLAQIQSTVTETEGDLECSQAEDLVKDAQAQSITASVKITEAATSQGQPQTQLNSEVNKQVSVKEEGSQPLKCCTTDKDKSEISSKKKRKSTSQPKPEVIEMGEEWQTPTTAEPEASSEADASVSGKKKKRKSLRAELQTDADLQITPESCEPSQEETTTSAKKNKKALTAEKKLGGHEGQSPANALTLEDSVTLVHCEDSPEGGKTTELDKPADGRTPTKKMTKKKSLRTDEAHKVVDATNESTVTPLKKKKKKTKQKDSKITVGEERAVVETPQGVNAEKLLFEITITSAKKEKKKKSTESSEIKDDTQSQAVGSMDGGLPSIRKLSKKKRKIPVVFEYEADELEVTAEEETDAQMTELGKDIGEPSTTLSTKMPRNKAKSVLGLTTDFITFQGNVAVPTPLFCKTNRSPCTPLSTQKKSKTPKSKSKKVTFGLKNNKTAEFRKTDRSLLVSPDGSSRVPFDPKQQPKFGVLKSPPTPFPNRKTSLNTPKTAPKRRPSAADFF